MGRNTHSFDLGPSGGFQRYAVNDCQLVTGDDLPVAFASDQDIARGLCHLTKRSEVRSKPAAFTRLTKNIIRKQAHDRVQVCLNCSAENDRHGTAAIKARIRSGSFTPGALSTPEDRST